MQRVMKRSMATRDGDCILAVDAPRWCWCWVGDKRGRQKQAGPSASGTLTGAAKISGGQNFWYRYRRAFLPTAHNNTPCVSANMSKTQWKDIPVVPTSQEFLDIVLSRTYDFLLTFGIIRGANCAQTEATSYADSCRLPDQQNPRFLYAQGQIHVRDFHRASVGHHQRLPAPRRYPPVPPRSSEHSLRCGPLQDRSGTAEHRQVADRGCRS